jgi:hypothetical protein
MRPNGDRQASATRCRCVAEDDREAVRRSVIIDNARPWVWGCHAWRGTRAISSRPVCFDAEMEVEIELPAEDGVGIHGFRPPRFVALGAHVELGDDGHGFETESVTQVGLGREAVDGAVVVGEFHGAEGLAIVANAVVRGGLEIVDELEGPLFGVRQHDAPLGVAHLDEVHFRRARLIGLERIDDMSRQGAVSVPHQLFPGVATP